MSDYAVGYGRPPTASRFPKGVSGNPKGRPRRKRVDDDQAGDSRQAFCDVILEEANRRVTIVENGRKVTSTILDLGLRRLSTAGLSGNARATQDVISLVLRAQAQDRSTRSAIDNELKPLSPMTVVYFYGEDDPARQAQGKDDGDPA